MLYYEEIDISEGTDINNASASKDYYLSLLLDKTFSFQATGIY